MPSFCPYQRVDARKPRRLPSDGAFVFLLLSFPPMPWPVIEVIHHRIAYRILPRLLPVATLDHGEHFAVPILIKDDAVGLVTEGEAEEHCQLSFLGQ